MVMKSSTRLRAQPHLPMIGCCSKVSAIRHKCVNHEPAPDVHISTSKGEGLSDQHPPPPWSGQQAWNDPYQDLYQDTGRRSYQTEPGVWRSGPDAVPGYQRGVRSGANVMKRSAIGVVALAVLAAA